MVYSWVMSCHFPWPAWQQVIYCVHPSFWAAAESPRLIIRATLPSPPRPSHGHSHYSSSLWGNGALRDFSRTRRHINNTVTSKGKLEKKENPLQKTSFFDSFELCTVWMEPLCLGWKLVLCVQAHAWLTVLLAESSRILTVSLQGW